jgi:hypothetical protein
MPCLTFGDGHSRRVGLVLVKLTMTSSCDGEENPGFFCDSRTYMYCYGWYQTDLMDTNDVEQVNI